MKLKKFFGLFLYAFGAVLALSLGAVNASEVDNLEKEMDVRYKLLKNLEEFANENSLSMKEVTSVVNDVFYNQELMSSKGGMALIEGDVFVNLRSDKNNLFFNQDGDEWVGESKKINQIVFLSGGRLCEAGALDGIENVVLVIFSEESVKYIDLGAGSGGFYDRK